MKLRALNKSSSILCHNANQRQTFKLQIWNCYPSVTEGQITVMHRHFCRASFWFLSFLNPLSKVNCNQCILPSWLFVEWCFDGSRFQGTFVDTAVNNAVLFCKNTVLPLVGYGGGRHEWEFWLHFIWRHIWNLPSVISLFTPSGYRLVLSGYSECDLGDNANSA